MLMRLLDVRKVKPENNLNEKQQSAHFYFINQTLMYESTPAAWLIRKNAHLTTFDLNLQSDGKQNTSYHFESKL